MVRVLAEGSVAIGICDECVKILFLNQLIRSQEVLIDERCSLILSGSDSPSETWQGIWSRTATMQLPWSVSVQ